MKQPTKRIYRAYLFFKENAGYATPPGKSQCALNLARAEDYARDKEWEYTWEWDESGCIGCDCGSKTCDCSTGAEHETLGCVLKDADGYVLGSLWGICGATREYKRVVQAELASEAMQEDLRCAEVCAL